VIARSVHPEYREVLGTYATHQGIPLKTVSFADSGRIDLKELEKAVAGRHCVRADPVAKFLWGRSRMWRRFGNCA